MRTLHCDVFAVELEGVLFESCKITRLPKEAKGGSPYTKMDKRMPH